MVVGAIDSARRAFAPAVLQVRHPSTARLLARKMPRFETRAAANMSRLSQKKVFHFSHDLNGLCWPIGEGIGALGQAATSRKWERLHEGHFAANAIAR
jgi:hypothetical protein